MSNPTTLAGWRAAGSPAHPAQPIADMVAMFKRHGYVCGYYPDERHLEASPPEDHTPFSHTPWPGSQPYPAILALDLMPHVEGDGKSLAPIARQIIADKRAGRAPWIKYVNWTDEDGGVHHTKWQPGESTGSSTDSGHIHISIRTDYVNSPAAAGWDPITPLAGTTAQQGDDMELTDVVPGSGFADGSAARKVGNVLGDVEKSLDPYDKVAWQNEGLRNSRTAISQGAQLLTQVASLTAAVTALAHGGTSVDTAAVIAHIDEVAATESATVAQQHDAIAALSTQVADLQHELAAYQQREATAARAEADALAQQ